MKGLRRNGGYSVTWYGNITDVPGITVGHADDPEALTGCTVVLCPDGAVAGGDVRGGAPGTRETDLLRPGQLVEKAHAVLLTGGSAFGLDAAAGVMRFLEERGHGFDTMVARVPIVPAAVIFDLAVGDPKRRPDAAMGYAACQNARRGRFRQGNAGAGMGATVGKFHGPAGAMKAGIGSYSVRLDGMDGVEGDAVVGAIVVVNAFGDILDWRTGRILAGTRNPATGEFVDTAEALKSTARKRGGRPASGGDRPGPGRVSGSGPGQNTTIGVVATNAALSKAEVNRVALMAHDGLARSVSPVHTMFDGDTIFVLSTGDGTSGGGGGEGDVSRIGAAAVEVVAEAVRRAVRYAVGIEGYPARRDLKKV